MAVSLLWRVPPLVPAASKPGVQEPARRHQRLRSLRLRSRKAAGWLSTIRPLSGVSALRSHAQIVYFSTPKQGTEASSLKPDMASTGPASKIEAPHSGLGIYYQRTACFGAVLNGGWFPRYVQGCAPFWGGSGRKDRVGRSGRRTTHRQADHGTVKRVLILGGLRRRSLPSVIYWREARLRRRAQKAEGGMKGEMGRPRRCTGSGSAGLQILQAHGAALASSGLAPRKPSQTLVVRNTTREAIRIWLPANRKERIATFAEERSCRRRLYQTQHERMGEALSSRSSIAKRNRPSKRWRAASKAGIRKQGFSGSKMVYAHLGCWLFAADSAGGNCFAQKDTLWERPAGQRSSSVCLTLEDKIAMELEGVKSLETKRAYQARVEKPEHACSFPPSRPMHLLPAHPLGEAARALFASLAVPEEKVTRPTLKDSEDGGAPASRQDDACDVTSMMAAWFHDARAPDECEITLLEQTIKYCKDLLQSKAEQKKEAL
eukprot:s968_g6.t1